MFLHRCADADCTYFGQTSPGSCACHKTDQTVLQEQRDELLEAAERLINSTFAEHYRLISPFKELVSAIAKARGEA